MMVDDIPELKDLMQDSVISHANLSEVQSPSELATPESNPLSYRQILEQNMLEEYYKAHPEKLPKPF